MIRSRIRIPDHFFTCVTFEEWGISGNLLAFLIYSHWPIFTTLGEMTDADNVYNESTTFRERSSRHPDLNPD